MTYTFFLQKISESAPYREMLINLPLIITVIELPSRIIFNPDLQTLRSNCSISGMS